MKFIKFFLLWFMVIAFLLMRIVVDAQELKSVYVGSTPCGVHLRSAFGITDDVVDFIRWELNLMPRSFVLGINYGQGQPNTPGFIGGGNTQRLEGKVELTKLGASDLQVYVLRNSSSKSIISFVRLDQALIHLLEPDNTLMVGTSGWSCTLSLKGTAPSHKSPLPATLSTHGTNTTTPMVVYEGRTPCAAIDREYKFGLGEDCRKIKWQIKLYFDTNSKLPSTYTINRTGHRETLIEGNWIIQKGTASSPQAVIYILDPRSPENSISLLAGDENVIFFLDKDLNLLPGDENFSYTLNRKNK